MRLLLSFILLLVIGGCTEVQNHVALREELKVNAEGGYSDIIVIVEDRLWDKGLKSDVSFVFSEELKGLYSAEQNFDVVHVPPKGFSALFKSQRIIVEFDVSSSILQSGVGYKENKFAKGQIYIKISAENFRIASQLLLESATSLRKKVNSHRLGGLQDKIKELSSVDINAALKGSVNVEMVLTKYFSTVVNEEGFAYFGKKAKGPCKSGHNSVCNYQLGLFVTKLGYDGPDVFEKKYFTALRDSITKRYIIGPEKDKPTYMECERSVPLSAKVITLDGHYCVEFRGWWNMVNATMGGPFISYLLVNEQTKVLYLIDGFLFAPNFRKRDFLIELEAMIKTFKVI
ncbi:MAG: hypothetical protein ACJA0Q_002086 [Saprospiraceae bacterium]|jgi:hypothetical protein